MQEAALGLPRNAEESYEQAYRTEDSFGEDHGAWPGPSTRERFKNCPCSCSAAKRDSGLTGAALAMPVAQAQRTEGLQALGLGRYFMVLKEALATSLAMPVLKNVEHSLSV